MKNMSKNIIKDKKWLKEEKKNGERQREVNIWKERKENAKYRKLNGNIRKNIFKSLVRFDLILFPFLSLCMFKISVQSDNGSKR